ncbi:MAG: hypothetical protein JWM28_3304, partial [Chitinophagaceae bacterium]|nr:hypothetical protein [Chitinophagaceae bacterium]
NFCVGAGMVANGGKLKIPMKLLTTNRCLLIITTSKKGLAQNSKWLSQNGYFKIIPQRC